MLAAGRWLPAFVELLGRLAERGRPRAVYLVTSAGVLDTKGNYSDAIGLYTQGVACFRRALQCEEEEQTGSGVAPRLDAHSRKLVGAIKLKIRQYTDRVELLSKDAAAKEVEKEAAAAAVRAAAEAEVAAAVKAAAEEEATKAKARVDAEAKAAAAADDARTGGWAAKAEAEAKAAAEVQAAADDAAAAAAADDMAAAAAAAPAEVPLVPSDRGHTDVPGPEPGPEPPGPAAPAAVGTPSSALLQWSTEWYHATHGVLATLGGVAPPPTESRLPAAQRAVVRADFERMVRARHRGFHAAFAFLPGGLHSEPSPFQGNTFREHGWKRPVRPRQDAAEYVKRIAVNDLYSARRDCVAAGLLVTADVMSVAQKEERFSGPGGGFWRGQPWAAKSFPRRSLRFMWRIHNKKERPARK